MNYHKKAAAFAASLLICLSTAAPAFSTYADNDDEVQTTAEETADTSARTDGTQTSGDFVYKIDDEGNAHISGCLSTAAEIIVPAEIDGIPVTELEQSAFINTEDKTQLDVERIVLPASIAYISSENPFAPCMQLKEIVVEDGNSDYCSVDGVIFTKDMKTLVCYPAKKDGTIYNIPKTVETIGVAAFESSPLTELTLPASVKEISRHSFSFMESLKKADMSKSRIGKVELMAFVSCTELEEVLFSDSTYEIGDGSFMMCKKLADVTLPPYLKEIGQSTFMGTAMTEIRIPETVQMIGYSALGYIDEVTKVENFTIIGTADSIAETYATDVDDEYDYENNFTFIDIKDVEAAEEYQALNPIEWGDYDYSVVDGEAWILACYSSDAELVIPSEIEGYKVTQIYKNAMDTCAPRTIVYPETVKIIGEKAFPVSAESITLPGGLEDIEDLEPFLNCTSLKEIIVTEGDGAFSSENGILYNKDKTKLYAYPIAKQDEKFKVPSTVTEISVSAFSYNAYLCEADLSSVEIIGDYAFEACAALRSVKLSENLKTVGNSAFIGCEMLKSVRLYDKLEYIGDLAFGYIYDENRAAEITQQASQGVNTSGMTPFVVMNGFKIYTEEGTLAYDYATACGIPIVTGTIVIGGKNVDKSLFAVLGGALGLLVVGLAMFFTGRKIALNRQKKLTAAANSVKNPDKKSSEKKKEDAEDEAE